MSVQCEANGLPICEQVNENQNLKDYSSVHDIAMILFM